MKNLVCVESVSESHELCPMGYTLAYVDAPNFVEQFSYLSNSAVFSIVFVFTLSCYILARSFGILIGMLR